ncbi:hypothetical protein C4G51_RS18605 [Vibrio parahaemolyticus]|nr:hypothetical protein [Vibrio parahaemolyticus]
MTNEVLTNIFYDIPDTNFSVTDTGELVFTGTGEVITNPVIKIKGKSVRTKTLILTMYKALDRPDLYPTVTNTWYELFNPEKGYKHYIDYSLIDFCKEHDINYNHAHNAMRRNISTSCGWSIRRKTN